MVAGRLQRGGKRTQLLTGCADNRRSVTHTEHIYIEFRQSPDRFNRQDGAWRQEADRRSQTPAVVRQRICGDQNFALWMLERYLPGRVTRRVHNLESFRQHLPLKHHVIHRRGPVDKDHAVHESKPRRHGVTQG